MDAKQFAYWLQGFAELNETPPTPEQWKSIREHLALVFDKVTPPVGVIRKAGDDQRMEPQQPMPMFPPDWFKQTPAREVPWWERQAQCRNVFPQRSDARSYC